MNGEVLQMAVIMIVVFGGMYLLTIRPQQKKERQLREVVGAMEVGDSILTTAGFYGVVVDFVDDATVIVEFGNDKHCRIPMTKEAISAVEKANAED